MPATLELRAGGRTVAVSNPDKVLFPEVALTKGELAAYYDGIAPVMIPHVRDRPVTMLAFPRGIEAQGHFLKSVPPKFPDWVPRVTVPKKGGTSTYPLANDAATLVLMANQNCITLHVWTSRADRIERPDRVIFDLDPSRAGDFARVRSAARDMGDLLRDLDLEPFAMATGSRGVHVVAPLRREQSFEDVLAFAQEVAEVLVARRPDDLTTRFHKADRGDRIFVDVLRNRWAQTVVAPYSVRPRPQAPVATPLRWEELSDARLAPDRWTVRTLHRRLARAGDPWKDITRAAASLAPARRRLAALRQNEGQ